MLFFKYDSTSLSNGITLFFLWNLTYRLRLRRIGGGRASVLAVIMGDVGCGVTIGRLGEVIRLLLGPLTPVGGIGLVLGGHGRGRRSSRSATPFYLTAAPAV